MKNTKPLKIKSSKTASSKKNFFLRFIKNKWTWISIASVVLLTSIAIGSFSIFINKTCSISPLPKNSTRSVNQQTQQQGQKVADERREESTYLTFPEWYIVYSAHEYADFIKTHPPSQFPYGGAIQQYWCGYNYVSRLTSEKYPYNSGAHTVLQVIGVSFTAEYLAKGLYEHVIGIIPELLSFGNKVEEDVFAYVVADDYANYLHHTPWYDYPFAKRLTELWTKTSFFGKYQLRKWERKFALSIEYGIKAGYGFVIRKATAATYAPAGERIALRVKDLPTPLLSEEPTIQLLKNEPERFQQISIPRYTEFTRILLKMAQKNVKVDTIAGNQMIFITVIAPSTWQLPNEAGQELFRMPILTQTQNQRIGIHTEVTNVVASIRLLQQQGIVIEHIYDY